MPEGTNLSNRDFGTELSEMIEEDLSISPETSPDRLTNYVIAKTIAILKGLGTTPRHEFLGKIIVFTEWTEGTWQKVDPQAIRAFRKAAKRGGDGSLRGSVGIPRARDIMLLCKEAVRELDNIYNNRSTWQVTTDPVTGVNTNTGPSKGMQQKTPPVKLPTVEHERLLQYGLPTHLISAYRNFAVNTKNSPELATKTGVMAKAYDHADKYSGVEPYECMREKISNFW